MSGQVTVNQENLIADFRCRVVMSLALGMMEVSDLLEIHCKVSHHRVRSDTGMGSGQHIKRLKIAQHNLALV